jgi:hypothetical protein
MEYWVSFKGIISVIAGFINEIGFSIILSCKGSGLQTVLEKI